MFRDQPLARRKFFGLAILLPWMGSCRSRPAEDASKSESRGANEWFTIRIGTTKFQLQVAVSPEEKAKGLMHRKSLAAGHGMLFLSEKPETQSFWMMNTWIPLDIGFFDSTGALLEVRKLHPHDERSVKSSSDNALFAIELNRHAYRDAAVKIGERLNLDDLRAALTTRGIAPADQGF